VAGSLHLALTYNRSNTGGDALCRPCQRPEIADSEGLLIMESIILSIEFIDCILITQLTN
jgi:hypothetical protein